MIVSGSVYIFDESHINRWTDSIKWSRLHIFGSFLLYRQVRSRSDVDDPNPAAGGSAAFAEHRPASVLSRPRADIAARLKSERMLLDTLPNDKHKADGFIKKVRVPHTPCPPY